MAQNKLFTVVVQVLYFYNKTRKYDNVRVAARTLVKAVLNVSSTGCNNERQSFVKMSYSAVDNVLTSLLPAGLQDFFQVLNVSNATTLITEEYKNEHLFYVFLFSALQVLKALIYANAHKRG